MSTLINQQCGAAVFEENLATPPAGGEGLSVSGNDAQCSKAIATLANEVADQRALSA